MRANSAITPAMPSAHGTSTDRSSREMPSMSGVSRPTAIRMDEDVMPGMMKLSPHSTPQKRKPQTFARISANEPSCTPRRAEKRTRKLMSSETYEPLSRPCVPASRQRSGSVPRIRPIKRQVATVSDWWKSARITLPPPRKPIAQPTPTARSMRQ